MHKALLLAIAAVALFCVSGADADAPASFQLVFDGRHNAAFLHEGTFTASGSWCPAGSAADVSVDGSTDTAVRRFTCAAGGDFTATVTPLPAEHGGSGTWQIIGGSGPLENLRGKGTFTSTRLTGSSDDPASITFRCTWVGVAAFDVAPPAARVATWSARKLKRPKGAYTIRLVLSLTDTGGGPVSYILQVVDPRRPSNTFVYKLGQTATGTATSSFRIKVSQKTRVVEIRIDASDAVGNESAFAQKIRLK